MSCPIEWTDVMDSSYTCCEEEGRTASCPRQSNSRVVSSRSHRCTGAGMHVSSPGCILSSANFLEAFSFVIHVGFQSLSEQMKMLLSTCFISLLETELFQAMEVSSFLLFHKKNMDSTVASFGLPVTAPCHSTTHSNTILVWINALLCDSLFTGIKWRECPLHHPLGISGIKKKLFFFYHGLPFFF